MQIWEKAKKIVGTFAKGVSEAAKSRELTDAEIENASGGFAKIEQTYAPQNADGKVTIKTPTTSH